MLNTLKVVAIILIALCVYLIGYAQGEQAVLENQIITNELKKRAFTSVNTKEQQPTIGLRRRWNETYIYKIQVATY